MTRIFHALALLAFLFTLGCGGPLQAAQASLTSTAHALVLVDQEVSTHYTAAADEAREHTASWAEYDAMLQPWNDAELGLRTAYAALVTAQFGLDAWRAGDAHGWQAAAPCLVEAVDRLRRLLEAAGLWLEPLTQALVLLSGFSGRCEVSP